MNPEQILTDWMAAINRDDLEAVLALYDEDAVLFPTFSSRVLNTPEKRREYFGRIAGLDDLSIALHEKTVRALALGGTHHILLGIYCWRYSVDGELYSFEARFSLALDLSRPRPIVHHHSSQIPRSI